ncbi:MAG: carboxymuconolactone decarboxylase family protein [Deltaproteobacteria bacterium]|nr:carboxymuconolactone decarboxylase family protein [Deltaproteobacteria bacterium]
MKQNFDKRIYDIKTFKRDLKDSVDHYSELRAAKKSGRISKAFNERICLAVTQVTGCAICSFVHTKTALRSGMSKDEIEGFLAGEFGAAPQEEMVALLFVQHYAETKSNPDPETWQRVVDTYGPEAAQDIRAILRMIMVGNLHGNTIEALRKRLSGNSAPNSSIWQELGVVLGIFVFYPWYILRRILSPKAKTSKATLN